MTVSDALATNRQLESVGGVAYLSSLTYSVDSGLARVTNVEHYARLILDKSRRRQAHAAGLRLSSATEDSTVGTDECLRLIQESLLQIEARPQKVIARSSGQAPSRSLPEGQAGYLRRSRLPLA